MILSHDDIEEIAAATISDFNDFFYKGGIPAMRTMPISTPIRSGSGSEKKNSAQSPCRAEALPQKNGWRSSWRGTVCGSGRRARCIGACCL